MGSRPGGAPVVVGHRANSGRIVFLYKRMGVRYVEVDVRSNNGLVVVGHGRPVINRATPIGRLWAWIDYKLFFRDPLVGVHRLSEWLRILQEDLGIRGVLLDLKTRVNPEPLAGEVEASGFRGDVYVSGEDHRFLASVKEALPGATVLASYSVMPWDIVGCTRGAGVDGVALRKDYVSGDVVEELHSSGLLVFAWTVNRVEDAVRVVEAGVDGVISDRPDIVYRALRRLGYDF